MPSEPQEGILSKTLCPCCSKRGAKGALGSSIPLPHPQLSPSAQGTQRAACPMCRAGGGEGEGDTSLSLVRGSIFPRSCLTHAQEAGEPLSYRGG